MQVAVVVEIEAVVFGTDIMFGLFAFDVVIGEVVALRAILYVELGKKNIIKSVVFPKLHTKKLGMSQFYMMESGDG